MKIILDLEGLGVVNLERLFAEMSRDIADVLDEACEDVSEDGEEYPTEAIDLDNAKDIVNRILSTYNRRLNSNTEVIS